MRPSAISVSAELPYSDRAAVVVEDARLTLGIDQLERAVIFTERIFVRADAREDEAELGGDALRLGAAGIEAARFLELGDGAFAAARAARLRMIGIGDRQNPRQDDVRRGIARTLADRLLAQRLRLIGDGKAALAIALLRNRAQELLRLLDEPGARPRRGAQEREQDGADDPAAQSHVPQYTPSIDLAPQRAV